MYYYISDSFSPSFNLSSEEYLMKETSIDFFMLYRNRSAVIIGKHQDAHAEINHTYVNNNNISVFRRISGGGAVYHDMGNLNYSFVTNAKEGCLVDFPKYIGIILQALQNMGINARMDKRSAIYSGNYKISGTACHVWRNRVIHHGTILFDVDTDKLNRCLKAGFIGYKPGMVASIRSIVKNVKYMIEDNIDMEEFMSRLISWVKQCVGSQGYYRLTVSEDARIRELEKQKYIQQQWNYGYQESRESLIV